MSAMERKKGWLQYIFHALSRGCPAALRPRASPPHRLKRRVTLNSGNPCCSYILGRVGQKERSTLNAAAPQYVADMFCERGFLKEGGGIRLPGQDERMKRLLASVRGLSSRRAFLLGGSASAGVCRQLPGAPFWGFRVYIRFSVKFWVLSFSQLFRL